MTNENDIKIARRQPPKPPPRASIARTPELHTDDHGDFFEVPVSNRRDLVALIDAADYHALRRDRRSLALFVQANQQGREYVLVARPDRGRGPVLTTAARLIMKPGLKRTVVYLDGNRLNLRRSNLRLHSKAAGGRRKIEKNT